MNETCAVIDSSLVSQASALVIRLNAVSISLLQRHLLLGHGDALALADALETEGIITAPGPDGYRSLTERACAMRATSESATARELFEGWAIDPFEGGDGGDPGTPQSPSIWFFGIEHGDARNIEQEVSTSRYERDYSIDVQMKYPFNQRAFKLFAAIHGEPVTQCENFARLHQPWVPGSKGFFKGNLYPYPCVDVNAWSASAASETGFDDKAELRNWCDEHRIPAIADAVRRHRPRLFIGIGATMANAFSKAFFGADVPLDVFQFSVNGFVKKIRYAKHNGGVLVVLPHLTGGANGLNSDESIQVAGSFIAGLTR